MSANGGYIGKSASISFVQVTGSGSEAPAVFGTSSAPILFKKTSITSAQLKQSVPWTVTLIPAQGANKRICLLGWQCGFFRYNFGTIAYTMDGGTTVWAMRLQGTSTETNNTLAARLPSIALINGQTESKTVHLREDSAVLNTPYEAATLANVPLELTVSEFPFISGDGTLDIFLHYIVVDES